MPEMDTNEKAPESDAPETDVPESPASNDIGFQMKPVDEKPTRRYRKGSKYDVVIEAFQKGKDKMVAVTIKGKDANYVRTQLNKRVEALKLTRKITVSVVNNVLYLEKK